MLNIIISMLFIILALLSLIYVLFAARRRGPILSNVYLAASKEKRKTMDTDQLYKECRNVFSLIFFMWGGLGLFILLGHKIFLYGTYFSLISVVAYGITISIKSLKDEDGVR